MIEGLSSLAEACLDTHKTTADIKEARRHFRSNIQAAYDLGRAHALNVPTDPIIVSRPNPLVAGHVAQSKPAKEAPKPAAPAPKAEKPKKPTTTSGRLRPDAMGVPPATPAAEPVTDVLPTSEPEVVVVDKATAAEAVKNF